MCEDKKSALFTVHCTLVKFKGAQYMSWKSSYRTVYKLVEAFIFFDTSCNAGQIMNQLKPIICLEENQGHPFTTWSADY